LTASKTRKLKVKGIRDSHNHYQFAGDGTAAYPNGYDREAFAFLPYQVNAHRFVSLLCDDQEHRPTADS